MFNVELLDRNPKMSSTAAPVFMEPPPAVTSTTVGPILQPTSAVTSDGASTLLQLCILWSVLHAKPNSSNGS